MSPLHVTPATARRFMRRALLLDEPAPDIATALAHHGYIQIDPINVCGRAIDLRLHDICNQVKDTLGWKDNRGRQLMPIRVSQSFLFGTAENRSRPALANRVQ